MPKNRMLIDASHEEETRVVVMKNNRVEEFDFESAARKLLKGSIYLAKITRVEPSLQAAFVDFGGNRHGFLAFNEVHPDYYQIPHADRQALLEAEAAANRDDDDDDDDIDAEDGDDETGVVEVDDDDDDDDVTPDDEEGDGDDRTDADVADISVASQKARDIDDAVAVEAADLAARERDGGITAAASETRADSDTAEAALPSDVDGHMPVAEPTPEIESDDAKFAEIDALAETHAIEVGHLLPEAPADPDAAASTDDAIVGDEPDVETSGDFKSSEAQLRAAGADARVASDVVDLEPVDLDPSEAIPGLDDQPVIPEFEDAVQGRRRTSDDDESGDDRDPDGIDADDDDDTDADAEPARRSGRARARNGGGRRNGGRNRGRDQKSRTPRRTQLYKIQEVVKRRQIVLVQVVKEERGTKGAALTTYLSLAGRYTVLMPNTARGGGISRKITNAQDRRRLKAIAQDLDVPEGMGLIIRTAGAARTKQEIKRDFEYLLRLWESVRDLTLRSQAPSLVYEEGNLIKRAIRDLYTKDVDEVLVAGNAAHREAKDFMRMLMPSHAKNVIKYDAPTSLFKNQGIENQLNALFSPVVTLPSGGYLVINQTEALVAIDINSGRATREFSIEETAHKTNLEAAAEISRQLKLRDLAGLIVIDFIDMDEKRNNRSVERKIKDCLKDDRARIQVGRISHFGLLEMSRQRLRTGMLEGSTSQCPHCQGTGVIRSVESVALAVLRGLEDAAEREGPDLSLSCAPDVAIYVLNHKRTFITELETQYGIAIEILGSAEQQGPNFAIEKSQSAAASARRPARAAVSMNDGFNENRSDEADELDARDAERETDDAQALGDDDGRNKRRRRRRGGRRSDQDEMANGAALVSDSDDEETSELAAEGADATDSEDGKRGRRRGRRGGRSRRDDAASRRTDEAPAHDVTDVIDEESATYMSQASALASAGAAARRRPRLDRERAQQSDEIAAAGSADALSDARDAGEDGLNGDRPTRKRRSRGGRGRNRAQADANANGSDAENAETIADDPTAIETPDTDAAETAHPVTALADETVADADVGAEDAAPSKSRARKPRKPRATKSADADVDAKPIEQPEFETAQVAHADASAKSDGDSGPQAPATDAASDDGAAADQPRHHWGDPKSSEPVLKRVTLNVDDTEASAESDAPPAAPAKKERRGWWQRNFG